MFRIFRSRKPVQRDPAQRDPGPDVPGGVQFGTAIFRPGAAPPGTPVFQEGMTLQPGATAIVPVELPPEIKRLAEAGAVITTEDGPVEPLGGDWYRQRVRVLVDGEVMGYMKIEFRKKGNT